MPNDLAIPTRREELTAETYLRALRIGDVIFEPRGNIAPDFLVGKDIAVEVRRLNQNYLSGGQVKGIEEDSIPLAAKVKKVLHGWPEPAGVPHDETWFIGHTIYNRPLDPWTEIRSRLEHFLTDFYYGDRQPHTEVRLTKTFGVHAIKASKRLATFYRLAGYSDHDAGGWVRAELTKNVTLCIEDKREALRSLSAYRERWLLLIDHIGYGHHEDFTVKRGGWDRIILISPEGNANAYEPREE